MRSGPVCLLLILVAACASPRDACVARETRDLQVIDGLISEQSAILERGYALERETVVRNRLQFCTGLSTGTNPFGFGGACIAPQTETRLVPEAVDLTEVRQRLASLQETRVQVARRSASAVASCPAG